MPNNQTKHNFKTNSLYNQKSINSISYNLELYSKRLCLLEESDPEPIPHGSLMEIIGGDTYYVRYANK